MIGYKFIKEEIDYFINAYINKYDDNFSIEEIEFTCKLSFILNHINMNDNYIEFEYNKYLSIRCYKKDESHLIEEFIYTVRNDRSFNFCFNNFIKSEKRKRNLRKIIT